MARSYGVSPRRRNALIVAGLFMTVPLALAGLLLAETALLITAVLVAAIVLPIFLLALGRARLRVSDEGVELRQLGWRVATPWHNVAGVRLDRGGEGLILHQPLSGKGAERLAAASAITFHGSPLYDAERLDLIAARRFIPIEAFAYWLEHGDLRAILSDRVPALSAPGAWTPPQPTRLPRRRLALIVAIISAALGLGIVLAFSSPQAQARAERLMGIPVAMAVAVYTVVNVGAAVRHLRAGRYAWAALWALMALVQALIVAAILGSSLAASIGRV